MSIVSKGSHCTRVDWRIKTNSKPTEWINESLLNAARIIFGSVFESMKSTITCYGFVCVLVKLNPVVRSAIQKKEYTACKNDSTWNIHPYFLKSATAAFEDLVDSNKMTQFSLLGTIQNNIWEFFCGQICSASAKCLSFSRYLPTS